MSDDYTEENALQALEYGEKQLLRAMSEFLMFRDFYRSGAWRDSLPHINAAHGATCGALVAIKELYEWTKPLR
jgi:hypothetical protein